MNRSKAAALCVLLGAFLLHVTGVMSYLVRKGRLSIVPIYDDVGYLIDGLMRLDVLDRAGIAGYLADFYVHPPHAPISSLTSGFGLMLSSGAVWGPYVLSAIWLVLVLLLGWLALRQAGPGVRVGILVAALAAPMFGVVLAEFRPDPVWGLLVGFAMIISASTDIVAMRASRLFALGLLFGAAVVAKPTAAPASALVLAVGFATQFGLSLLARRTWSIGLVIRTAAVLMLGAACLVVPYLVCNGAGTLAYIRQVTGGGSMWKLQMSAWDQITYYLNRGTAMLMLGWVWYAAMPVLAICAAVLIRARDKQALAGFGGTLAAVLVSYLIVTVSSVKSLLIGSILYGTIIAAVVWCLGQIVTRITLRERAALLLGLLVFATQWSPRVGMIHREDPAMAATEEASVATLPPLLEALRANPRGAVLVTVPGPVYAGTLDFLSRQQGVVRTFVSAYTWETWDLFAHAISASDVIVLSEAGMTGQSLAYAFPSVPFQARLLETLRSSPDFKGRPVYTDKEQRSVWLFVRSRH